MAGLTQNCARQAVSRLHYNDSNQGEQYSPSFKRTNRSHGIYLKLWMQPGPGVVTGSVAHAADCGRTMGTSEGGCRVTFS